MMTKMIPKCMVDGYGYYQITMFKLLIRSVALDLINLSVVELEQLRFSAGYTKDL
jgi:hypothetical protein